MIVGWIGLLLVAFLPPVLYVAWIRNTERRHREPWKPVLLCFAWGATVAIIVSVILEVILDIPLTRSLSDYNVYILISVVVIAPVVEEFAKPLVLGLKAVRKESDEVEDGFIYGAAAGLGFAATENLFYEWRFMSRGLVAFLVIMVIRCTACCLLHASATAFTGYGCARAIIERRRVWAVLPFFVLAIGVHAFYNFAVFFSTVGGIVSVGVAILFAVFCIGFVRRQIRKFDSLTENSARGKM